MFKKTLLLVTLGSIVSLQSQVISNKNCEPKTPSETPGDIGCVELTYQNQTVNYLTVRAADGNEWLQQNLGSTSVAASIDQETARGDYFQYGRWDDGHQLKNSETSENYPTPNNPKGLGEGTNIFYINGGSPWSSNYNGWWANPQQNDTWTAKTLAEVTDHNGMDPCTALGQNWEMPSEVDWDIVMQKEKIFPRPENDNRNGITRAFESHLKIPGAGARKDDSFAFEGQRAYLWTKSSSANPNFYRYVYLGSSTASTTGFGGDAKSFGYSVRCVNKNKNLGIDLNTKKTELNITPNPANKYITIHTLEKIKTVQLINFNGQKILESNNTTIDISKLQSGNYLVSVQLENGKTFTKKIIKK